MGTGLCQRESLGTSFLVASSPSKQTLPCLDSKRCTGFLRIKDPGAGPVKLTLKNLRLYRNHVGSIDTSPEVNERYIIQMHRKKNCESQI